MTTTTAPSVSQFNAAMPLASIEPHPKNVRHSAKADPELVESVKANGVLEPLIVANHPDKTDTYVLIAGHRRLDACKKARRPTAPAVIRADLITEAQQVEAMLVENLHRQDLTVIEEAEGYQQLTLFGLKQGAIAKAVGRDPKTIAGRLRLLKLRPSTQKKVHDGQISIDDALALAVFTDDPKTTAELEKSIGTGNFKWDLQRAKDIRKTKLAAETRGDDLEKAGATRYTMPKGKDRWDLGRNGLPEALTSTFSDKPADHPECYGFTLIDNYNGPAVLELCLNPGSHADQLDAAEKQRRLEEEQRTRDAEERQALEQSSAVLRCQSLLGLVKPGLKLDPALSAALRNLLPLLVFALDDSREHAFYQDAMGLDPDARWSPWIHSWKARDRAVAEAHASDLADGSPPLVAKALLAVLGAHAERRLGRAPSTSWDPLGAGHAEAYLTFLEGRGHELSPVDLEYLATARGENETEREAS